MLPCRVRIVSVSCRIRRELVGWVIIVIVGFPPVGWRDTVSILPRSGRVPVVGLFGLSWVVVIVCGRFVSRVVVVMREWNWLVSFNIIVRFYVFIPWVFIRARGRWRFRFILVCVSYVGVGLFHGFRVDSFYFGELGRRFISVLGVQFTRLLLLAATISAIDDVISWSSRTGWWWRLVIDVRTTLKRKCLYY